MAPQFGSSPRQPVTVRLPPPQVQIPDIFWQQAPPAVDSNYNASKGTSSGKSSSAVTPGVVSAIALLAAAFLLVSYYRIFGRYCAFVLWGNSRRRGQEDSSSDTILDAEPVLQERSNGVEEALIQKIPVYLYREEDVLIDSTECSVCLGEFQDHEHLRLLPKCGHAFHLPCIDRWLQEHSSCPLCRAPIVLIHHAPASSPILPASSPQRQQPQQSSPSSTDDQISTTFLDSHTNSHPELRPATSSFSARGRTLLYSLSARVAHPISDREGLLQRRASSLLSGSVSQKGSGSGSDLLAFTHRKQAEPQKMQGLPPVRGRLLTRSFSVQGSKLGNSEQHPATGRNSTKLRQPFLWLRRSNSTGSLRATSVDPLQQSRKPACAGPSTSTIYDVSCHSCPSSTLLMNNEQKEVERRSHVAVVICSQVASSSGIVDACAMKPRTSLNNSHELKLVLFRSNNSRSAADHAHLQNKPFAHESIKPKETFTDSTGGIGSEDGYGNSPCKLSKSGPLTSKSTMNRSFSGGKLFHFLHGRRHLSEIPRQPV